MERWNGTCQAHRLRLPAVGRGSTKIIEAVAKCVAPTTTSIAVKMFENLCALPVDHDIFVQAIHPKEPLVAVGLASGHVLTYKLPEGASEEDDDETKPAQNGFGTIDKLWKTRRHKGSCRTLGYSVDGSSLYSAGTDGMVKIADSTTGQVTAKIAVPLDT